MNERRTDFELLRDFARLGDQETFAAVVRRHIDLVYAAALRKLEHEGAAEEVSQNVFTALARKAWQFAPDDSLPAWLYRSALLEAKVWLRGELRRRRREQTAAELGTTMNTPDQNSAFRALIPLLDEALLSLREKDRTALLLRFYENQSLREVGASLGVGEDAAQKRVAGAVEQLARFYQRRGYRTGSAAATAAALQHTAAAAPAWLTTSILSTASRATSPALIKLLAGRFIGLTKIQKALFCLAVAVIPFVWQWASVAPGKKNPVQQTDVATESSPSLKTRPSMPTPVTRQSVELSAPQQAIALPQAAHAQREKEYTVRLRGLIAVAEFKAVLLQIQHHSLGRANTPPFLVHRILTVGEAFDDRSVAGASVHFELLQIDAATGTIRVKEDAEEDDYRLEDKGGAELPSAALAPICLVDLEFEEFVGLYAQLMSRTVLCHPLIKRQTPFSIRAGARSRSEAVRLLERLFQQRRIETILRGDKFVLVAPADLSTSVAANVGQPKFPTSPTDEILPAGTIYLEGIPLLTVLEVYGELSGRKLVQSGVVETRSGLNGFFFCSQTALTKAEALYAFDVLLGWQGYEVVSEGSTTFKVVRLRSRK